MTLYIIVTLNTDAIRLLLNGYPDTQLVGSQETFQAWLWENPASSDLAFIQGQADYKGIVQIA